MASSYNTVSDVRQGAAVTLPTLTEDDSFVVIKVGQDFEDARVTLYNLTPAEAIDALMGVVMAIGGGDD